MGRLARSRLVSRPSLSLCLAQSALCFPFTSTPSSPSSTIRPAPVCSSPSSAVFSSITDLQTNNQLLAFAALSSSLGRAYFHLKATSSISQSPAPPLRHTGGRTHISTRSPSRSDLHVLTLSGRILTLDQLAVPNRTATSQRFSSVWYRISPLSPHTAYKYLCSPATQPFSQLVSSFCSSAPRPHLLLVPHTLLLWQSLELWHAAPSNASSSLESITTSPSSLARAYAVIQTASAHHFSVLLSPRSFNNHRLSLHHPIPPSHNHNVGIRTSARAI